MDSAASVDPATAILDLASSGSDSGFDLDLDLPGMHFHGPCQYSCWSHTSRTC